MDGLQESQKQVVERVYKQCVKGYSICKNKIQGFKNTNKINECNAQKRENREEDVLWGDYPSTLP